MLCCDCLVRVTWQKSDRVIGCLLGERVGSVFSHSALLLSVQRGLPGSWNTPTIHSYRHKHIVGVDVQKHTHTLCYTHVLQVRAKVQT